MTTRREMILGAGAATLMACGHRPDDHPPSGSAPQAGPQAAAPPAKPPKPDKDKPPELGDIPLAMKGPLPRRALGSTGVDVSLLCLGGYHLGNAASPDDAARIVHEAMEHGLDFFDSAWEYHDGKSEEWLGKALVGRRDKAFVMTKVCTHGRGADVAMKMLEESLRRLQTDHLDLWQVHEVVYESDPALHYAKGGVLEALTAAKKSGKVRFVGFTGHKHPSIHLDMLARGFPFDTVQMPINCFDGTGFRSFERQVLPEVQKRGMGALGMKSMTGRGKPVKDGTVTPAEALGYAMSQPVSAVVSGIDSIAVLHQNLNLAGGFTPWPEAQRQALRDRLATVAADGRYELFKTSMEFEGKPGREQHGFPPPDDLAG